MSDYANQHSCFHQASGKGIKKSKLIIRKPARDVEGYQVKGSITAAHEAHAGQVTMLNTRGSHAALNPPKKLVQHTYTVKNPWENGLT